METQTVEAPTLQADKTATSVQFIISSAFMHRQIKSLLPAISVNPIVPILENTLFSISPDELTLTASNLSQTVTCRMPIEVAYGTKPDATVGFCINAKRLYKLLTDLPEQPITVSFNGEFRVSILAEGGTYNFFAEPWGDFPKLPEVVDPQTIKAEGKDLTTALIQTLPFTCDDDLRPAMTGVYFNQGRFVATDGHRLIRVESNIAVHGLQFIVPYSGGSIFLKACGKSDSPVTIDVTKSNIRFAWANYTVTARLIDEKFPDYEAAISINQQSQVIVNRQAFIRLIGRVKLFTNRASQIALSICGGKIRVNAENLDEDESCFESLNANVIGEDITIGFNASILQDSLKSMPGSHVQLLLSAPNRAVMMHPHDGQPDNCYTSLVMPIMLKTYA